MRRAWVDLGVGDVGLWHGPHSLHELFGDHGLGLLLTLAKQHGFDFDVIPISSLHSWAEYRMLVKEYDLICMNVRSWRYAYAVKAAQIAKSTNPNSQVWAGGMHATVARQEMEEVEAFDVIVSRDGEGTFIDLLQAGGSSERFITGTAGKWTDMDTHPYIDRELWPKTPGDSWPLESPGGWVAGHRTLSMIVGRFCPYKCAYCYPSEKNHFGKYRRRSIDHTFGEMHIAQERWGPISSIIFHDGEWLLDPKWLDEFIARYPAETPNWEFWAACRADLLLKWQPRVRPLIKDCNWHCISIGLESGSDKMLKIMEKGTTADQNNAAIDLINGIGDEMQAAGRRPPVIFANVMLATPGEEPEDAFATMRMLARIKRGIPSISFFTPYPGSTLGDRMIAEGRSLDVHKKYLRYPNEAKVLGIDYQFYADLFNGRYNRECGLNVPELLTHQGSAGEALQ